jgi:hypothetical protein
MHAPQRAAHLLGVDASDAGGTRGDLDAAVGVVDDDVVDALGLLERDDGRRTGDEEAGGDHVADDGHGLQ